MEQKIHHNIDQNALLSESYMIQHKADRFMLDFKGMNVQHMDPANQLAIVVNHKAVMMDPWKMKEFVENAQENIKKYEKIHGKIKVPDFVEKEIKNTKKTSKASKDTTHSKEVVPKQSYF